MVGCFFYSTVSPISREIDQFNKINKADQEGCFNKNKIQIKPLNPKMNLKKNASVFIIELLSGSHLATMPILVMIKTIN